MMEGKKRGFWRGAKLFFSFPFRFHLFFGLAMRLGLIIFADYQDKYFELPYTDVDYKVFTDAARHVLRGNSPYKRHTYRYSPIIAYLMTPNIIIGQNFGKYLFSIFDVFITIAIKNVVKHQLDVSKDKTIVWVAEYSALFWIYNPMSMAISTRGSADSVSCFFIILSILFLQTGLVQGLKKYALSGICLGISIHLRIYPLVFSFPMFISLGEYKITRKTRIRDGFLSLLPNKKQIILTLSCVTTLTALTYGMYVLYNYEFLFETYIYHLFRKDTRHNFSVLFYYSYLTMDQLTFDVVKAITLMLELIILFVISLAFGSKAHSLSFALFCQSVVLVAFNGVMTSQYFVWYLSLLPLVVHDLKMTRTTAIVSVVVWAASQLFWLYYAFLLEFECEQVFLMIWLGGLMYYFSNVFALGQIIKSYHPGYGFGHIHVVTKAR